MSTYSDIRVFAVSKNHMLKGENQVWVVNDYEYRVGRCRILRVPRTQRSCRINIAELSVPVGTMGIAFRV